MKKPKVKKIFVGGKLQNAPKKKHIHPFFSAEYEMYKLGVGEK